MPSPARAGHCAAALDFDKGRDQHGIAIDEAGDRGLLRLQT